MALNVPNFMLGQHLQACTIQPVYVDINGNLTFTGGLYSLVGHLDAVRIDNDMAIEEISAMDTTMANNVFIHDDYSIVLTEILKAPKNGSVSGTAWGTRSLLLDWSLLSGYRQAYISFTSGLRTWAGYFLYARLEENHSGKGKRTIEVLCKQMGVSGSGNPTYG